MLKVTKFTKLLTAIIWIHRWLVSLIFNPIKVLWEINGFNNFIRNVFSPPGDYELHHKNILSQIRSDLGQFSLTTSRTLLHSSPSSQAFKQQWQFFYTCCSWGKQSTARKNQVDTFLNITIKCLVRAITGNLRNKSQIFHCKNQDFWKIKHVFSSRFENLEHSE